MQPEKVQAASGFEPLSGGLADLSASMVDLKKILAIPTRFQLSN